MARYIKSGSVSTVPEINSELEKIATAQTEFLSRSGEAPNEMLNTLDMNNNRITNLRTPVSATDAARLVDITGEYDVTVGIDETPVFDNVAEMTSTNLAVGQLVRCKRYYSGGDLVDGLEYEVQASATVDNFIDHANVNGTFSVLVVGNTLYSSRCGAVQSSTVDSSLVVQAMSNYCTAGAGQTIVIEGDVLFETKPTIIAGVSVLCTGNILCDTPNNNASLVIGDRDVFIPYPNIKYDISMSRKIESDFSTLENAGVIFENIIDSDITLRRLAGFTTGAIGRGNTSTSPTDGGFAWNRITLGSLENMLIGFDFRLISGGGGVAFANQNSVFHYGRIMQRNANATLATTKTEFVEGSVINCYAIRAENINGTQFYNQSLELSWTRSSDSQVFRGTGFLFNDCANNNSYNSRFENTYAVAKLTGDCRDNVFTTLYSDTTQQPLIIDESDKRTNKLTTQDNVMLNPIGASWDSGPLAQMTQQYTSGKIATVGASWTYTSGGNEPTIQAFDTTMSILPDGIKLGSNRGITYRLETQRNKRFVIRRMMKEGSLGRILISARKADGTQWTDVDTDAPYVRAGIALTYTGATFAGWKEPVNSDRDLFFSVNDDVDHVLIQFSQGILQRVQIQSLEQGSPIVTSGFRGYNTTQRVSTISPVDGFWTAGEEAVNTNASASQPTHWKAQQTGWACGTAWVVTTPYAVDDIIYNGANVYICRTAGTSSGAGGPTGTSLNITDGTVVWDYVALRVTFRSGPLMP